VLGGDNVGFSSGRRPADDVVDIELRVAVGVLCTLDLGGCKPADAPAGALRGNACRLVRPCARGAKVVTAFTLAHSLTLSRTGGSVAIAALASAWFVERAFDVQVLTTLAAVG
jgi:hypothetical protein